MRLFSFIFCFAALFCPDVRAQTKIIAQVNDDIVSELDLQQRLAFIRLTGQADTSRKDIRNRILKQLIDEKLKQQEARAAGIEVSDAEIKQAVKMTLQQNGLKYDEVMRTLKQNDLPVSVIEDQIKSDLLYIRAIKKSAGARTDVSDREVEARIGEIKEKTDQRQYLVSEILLPVENPEKDAETYGLAMQLIMRMRDGEVFEDIAEKYSKAPSAAQGGMVGWIGENMLTPAVREELSVMRPGQLSTPVKTNEGYKLFVLHAVRDPADSAAQQESVHLMQLFLPQTLTAKQRQAVLRDLNMTKGSCSQFKAVSEQLQTTPRVDLGKVPFSELPGPIHSVINRTALLEPSLPLPIEGGDLIFMACSREKVSLLPGKEDVKMQIESQRLEAIAQRRLRELRRNAVTEIR
ncbi:MAG: peptidylprolyl isomerase [Alphaproteobacteria bacterium]